MDAEKKLEAMISKLDSLAADNAKAAEASVALKASNEDLAGRLELAEKSLNEVREAQITRAQGMNNADLDKEVKENFSLIKFANAIRTKNWSDAGFEREASKEAQSIRDAQCKAMGVAVDSAGGFIVPEAHAGDLFIEKVYAQSQVASMATHLDDQVADVVNIPGMSTGATSSWVAEGATLTAANQVVFNKTMSPNKLAALIDVNNELFRRGTSPDAERMIMTDIASKFASDLDAAILAGSGSGAEPLGVSNDATVLTNVFDAGAAITHTDLSAIIAGVSGRNHLKGKLAWVMDSTSWKNVMNILDSQSRPLYVLTQGNAPGGTSVVATLLTYPVIISNNMTSGEVLFGDWSEVLVASWGGLRIDVSDQSLFGNDQSQIRAIQEADILVRHSEAFELSTGSGWNA